MLFPPHFNVNTTVELEIWAVLYISFTPTLLHISPSQQNERQSIFYYIAAACKMLRELRENNIRDSSKIVDLGERIVRKNNYQFGDEFWLICEQVLYHRITHTHGLQVLQYHEQ